MSSEIKFGTSGWRGIIADDFTYPQLRICTQAIAEEIFRKKEHNKPIVVGYDTRFMSEKFALAAANVLTQNGIEVRLSDRDVPTPVIAHEIICSKASGGVNITASHNPWDYNGLKFSSAWGGPALLETTKSIEALASLIADSQYSSQRKATDPHYAEKLIQKEDFRSSYMKHLKTLVNPKPFKQTKLKVVVDVLWGTGRGYLPELLRELGCEVEVLHETRDVMFGGRGPDPSTEGLEELVERVKKTKAHLGLATDGDADRFGVVDAGGIIYQANDILALLARYLHESRGWDGIVAKSVMTTHAIDALARKTGLELKETPVGFKYIGEIMKEADSIMPAKGGEFVMGGEESGGFTMRGHVPEKDGILACVLVAEMVAAGKKTLKGLLESFYKDIGVFISKRINIKATPDVVSALKEQFASKPPVDINGLHVHRIVDTDGYKFIFEGGSWLGVRFSGTEPIVRLYLEAESAKQIDVLGQAGQWLLHHVAASKTVTSARKARSKVLR